MARPERVFWHDRLLPLHIWMSYVGMGLVAFHVMAALYHHFGRRDEVLVRMLPLRTLRRPRDSVAGNRTSPASPQSPS
jgi:cytochrome b561